MFTFPPAFVLRLYNLSTPIPSTVFENQILPEPDGSCVLDNNSRELPSQLTPYPTPIHQADEVD